MSDFRELTAQHPQATVQQTKEALQEEARRLGFARAGVTGAVSPPGLEHFHQWLASGYAGEMEYLANRREAYHHPRHVLEGVRSLLVLLYPYRTAEPQNPTPGQGRLSQYGWGLDYHDVIRKKLHQLGDLLRTAHPQARTRGVVDTAPLLEGEFAQLAGLGWIGKNTLLLNRQLGSWFFLAALLTDLELPADEPFRTDHCGTCTACLDACPTEAFVGPYVLDARRCISYLTIELRGPIPKNLRPAIGDWVLGCDLCQTVCPWNSKSPFVEQADLRPRRGHNPLELMGLFALSDEEFRQRFRGTPLWRPRRRGILRNAAVVLGNQRYRPAVSTLLDPLDDADSVVRGAVAWALGQIGGTEAVEALDGRLARETDKEVIQELQEALAWAQSRLASFGVDQEKPSS